MEQIKYFFENSTIHGLFYISSTRKCSKLFWTIVVITGFSCAFTLIQQAFDIWNESPISTTLEILPISRITFPNVTVCPPKNSVLDLNFDLQLAEKNKMDDYLRNKILDYILDIEEGFYENLVANLKKVNDPRQFYDWYHGYAKISYPYHDENTGKLWYFVHTSASVGNISVDSRKEIEQKDVKIQYRFEIDVPESDAPLKFIIDGMKITNNFTFECFNCTITDNDDVATDLGSFKINRGNKIFIDPGKR